MQIKNEYDVLLRSGDLMEMYPGLQGSWQKDKKAFTQLWEQNRDALLGIEVDLETDEDFYDE